MNMENPESIEEKIEVVHNLLGQLRIAWMIGDNDRFEHALAEMERHLTNAALQIEEIR